MTRRQKTKRKPRNKDQPLQCVHCEQRAVRKLKRKQQRIQRIIDTIQPSSRTQQKPILTTIIHFD
jgi:hypothetical protein